MYYGCGVGSFAEKVTKYSPRKVTGIDISEISIDKAKKKAKELNININYKVDNCEKTSLDQNSFDIVWNWNPSSRDK